MTSILLNQIDILHMLKEHLAHPDDIGPNGLFFQRTLF